MFTFTFTVAVAGVVVVVLPSEPVLVVGMPAVTVTFAVLFVVNTDVATPFASVLATDELNEPLSVENVTGTPIRMLPPVSLTRPLMVDDPPLDDTTGGLALATTPATAAAPTAILTAPAAATLDPPDVA